MKVNALPVDPGPAAWNDILAPRRPCPALDSTIQADVVVVGAGFAGLSAAQRLQDLGVQRVVLLEAKALAEGPAGRNSGFMIDLPHELNSDGYTAKSGAQAREIRLNRLGIGYAVELAERYGLSRSAFHQGGRMTGAATEAGAKHLEQYAQQLAAQNEPFTPVTGDQLQAITGGDFYRQGLYTPGAAMIQPAALVRGIAQGMVQAGVQLYEHTPVLEFSRTGNTWSLKTPQGQVNAGQVILAVNGHVQSFGHYPKRLLHVFTYASMTRALSDQELRVLGGQDYWGMLPADPMGTTVRKDHRRIVIRNHATLNQNLQTTPGDMRRAARLQDKSLAARFPSLQARDFEYRWGGRLCLSINSVHAFGELETNLYSACCQNGLGTAKGMLSGLMAADLVVQGSTPELEEFQAGQSPKALVPDPFLSLGAKATLRYKEWRAGVEL